MRNYSDISKAKRILGYDLPPPRRWKWCLKGEIVWDSTRPDGTPRKLLDVSKVKALGWNPKISLEDGIRRTYEWYRHPYAIGSLPACG